MSSTGDPDSDRESLDKLLDALVFAPLGLLAGPARSNEDLAARGRRHLEAAKLLGRMALDHPPTSPTTGSNSEHPPAPDPGSS